MIFRIISEIDPNSLPSSKLDALAKALTYQSEKHLFPFWGKSAQVVAYNSLVDDGAIPIYIKKEIDTEGQNGYHWQDENGKPYIIVKFNPDFDQLCLTTSHEFLETIINPNIDKYKKSENLVIINRKGEEFFEICDVTQSKSYSYRIDGVMVSNFVTPDYYTDNTAKAGKQYDFLKLVQGPGEILDGGYKSFKLSDSEVLQAYKVKGVVLWKKITGSKVVQLSVSSTENTDFYILGFVLIVSLLGLIFKQKRG